MHFSKGQLARKLDNKWNSYHVRKPSCAPMNRHGDILPPCLIRADVAFFTREKMQKKEEKLVLAWICWLIDLFVSSSGQIILS